MTIESFEKFIFYSPDGCWYWLGALQSKGYGQFRNRGAHRVSYMLYKNVDPGNLNVCHSCDNRMCVNPNHLWLGTHLDNVMDKVMKGRQSRGPNHSMNVMKGISGSSLISYGSMQQIEHVGYVKGYRNFPLWRFKCLICGNEEIAHNRKIRRRKFEKCKNC